MTFLNEIVSLLGAIQKVQSRGLFIQFNLIVQFDVRGEFTFDKLDHFALQGNSVKIIFNKKSSGLF